MSNNDHKRIVLKNHKIIHLEGRSIKTKIQSLKMSIIFRDSMYKYFKKHSHPIKYLIFYLIITPLLATLLLSKKYPKQEKIEYCKMLLRKPFDLTKI